MKNEGKKKGPYKGKSRLQYHGKDVMVLSDSSPAAILLYTCIHVKVPAQGTFVVKNSFGEVVAKALQGALTVQTTAALIRAEEGQGELMVSTGSGNIDIMKHEGHVTGFTGSGDMTFSSCAGSCALEAGISTISIKDCTFGQAHVKSGAGVISLKATAADLIATTGSGKVMAEDFIGKKLFKVESGSGNVRVKGDFSQLEELFIQTGSGNIAFISTPFPKLAFDITTGNGRIAVAIPGFKTKQTLTRSVKFGEGRPASIRTGSGNVNIETVKLKKKTASQPSSEEKR
jgi:DUF4097 and DUF4098 domain-containing protein YvlB